MFPFISVLLYSHLPDLADDVDRASLRAARLKHGKNKCARSKHPAHHIDKQFMLMLLLHGMSVGREAFPQGWEVLTWDDGHMPRPSLTATQRLLHPEKLSLALSPAARATSPTCVWCHTPHSQSGEVAEKTAKQYQPNYYYY